MWMIVAVDRLAVNTFASCRCFERGGFTSEFEFWSLREVDVVLKIVGAWQRLASDTRLASGSRKGG